MRIEVLNACRSEPQSRDAFVQQSVELLKKRSYEVNVLPDFADPQDRASLFVDTISRGNIDYTWMVRGGIETINILPYIDFSSLQISNILIGSSDSTHLALPIIKRGSTVFYGPDFRGLTSNLNLTDDDRDRILKTLEIKKIDNSQLDVVSLNGRNIDLSNLVGGTLQIFLNLVGTEYCPNLEGRSVYIEHHYIPGETYLEAKYWLSILKLKTCSVGIKSLLVGELIFQDGEKEASQDAQISLAHEVMGKLDVPVGFLKTSHRRSILKLG